MNNIQKDFEITEIIHKHFTFLQNKILQGKNKQFKAQLQKMLCNDLVNSKKHCTDFWSIPSSINWWKNSKLLIIIAVFSSLLAVNFLSNNQPPAITGEIINYNGELEILRHKEILTAEKNQKIYLGDWLKLDENSSAEIKLNDTSVITLGRSSFLRIADNDKIFINQGILEINSLQKMEISTEKGIIMSPKNSKFSLQVSNSGEVKISVEENKILVFDIFDGSLELKSGEILLLKSDTKLNNFLTTEERKDLSLQQLVAIEEKLKITRSKFITGLLELSRNEPQGIKDIISAQKTFTSIVGILQTKRQKRINLQRNLENIKLQDVYLEFDAKFSQENKDLKNKIKAMENILILQKALAGKLHLSAPNSEIISFNRYTLLSSFLQQGNEMQKNSGKIFLDNYLQNFLSEILTKKTKKLQIAQLKTKISALPSSSEAREFLQEIKSSLNAEWQKIITEIIEKKF